ncbi:MAG: hypothetical protein SXG53_27655, partial [Pseudomonadota bacterium]|nr:hypothetical protein [Pseudomonadota bacterium]
MQLQQANEASWWRTTVLHKIYRAAASFFLLGAVASLVACGVAQDDSADFVAAGKNWAEHGGTSEEQRFSGLNDINVDNVNELGLAWSYELDTNRGQEATPLAIDGVLYTSTAWSKVVALDGATGKLLWSHDPQVPGETGFKACCDVINR